MAMTPLTPLGKPLTQNALPGNQVPASAPHASASAIGQAAQAGQPDQISAFQWVSLARATWTWLIRPLWYFCFVWPTKLMRYMLVQPPESDADRRRRIQRYRQNEEDRKFFQR